MAGEAPADYVFGSVRVQTSEPRRATVEEILGIAGRISAAIRAAPAGGSSALHARLCDEHPEFASSFGVVLRLMVETRDYSPDVMREFLDWYARQEVRSMEDSLRAQGEWPVLMMCARRRIRADGRAAREVRKKVVGQLLAEHKAFVDTAAKVDREFQEREDRGAAARRAALRELCDRLRRGDAAGPPAGSGARPPSSES